MPITKGKHQLYKHTFEQHCNQQINNTSTKTTISNQTTTMDTNGQQQATYKATETQSTN